MSGHIKGIGRRSGRLNQAGLTLLETLISAFILLIVLLGMVTAYTLSRINLDREETKRRATALARDRLEQFRIRALTSGGWSTIVTANPDTSYTVEGTTFTLTKTVQDSGNVRKTVTLTVNWTAKRNNNTPVARSITATTTIARDVTPGT